VTPFGIAPRDVLALVREHQRRATHAGAHLLVTGVLAEQLARELRAGGDAAAVRTAGDPAGAAALVHVAAGALTPEAEASLRAATRALVPVVVVQTADRATRLPYVLPTDIVVCEPGRGFPLPEVADALAAALGREGASLAASLPVVREAVQRRRAGEGALTAGTLAASAGAGPRLPLLALAQARLLLDVQRAGGAAGAAETRAAAAAVAPPLAAALGSGLATRTLVRRLPGRSRLLEGALAAAVTYGLATAFRQLGASRS
jgi:hypothetical protein